MRGPSIPARAARFSATRSILSEAPRGRSCGPSPRVRDPRTGKAGNPRSRSRTSRTRRPSGDISGGRLRSSSPCGSWRPSPRGCLDCITGGRSGEVEESEGGGSRDPADFRGEKKEPFEPLDLPREVVGEILPVLGQEIAGDPLRGRDAAFPPSDLLAGDLLRREQRSGEPLYGRFLFPERVPGDDPEGEDERRPRLPVPPLPDVRDVVRDSRQAPPDRLLSHSQVR